MPPQTLEAFADHGVAEVTLHNNLDEARALPEHLSEIGVDLGRVFGQLLEEGVEKFKASFDSLLDAIEEK